MQHKKNYQKQLVYQKKTLSRLAAETGLRFRGGYTKKVKGRQRKPKLWKTKRKLKEKQVLKGDVIRDDISTNYVNMAKQIVDDI